MQFKVQTYILVILQCVFFLFEILFLPEGLKGVDETGEVTLTAQLLLQPGSGQPVSCVGVVFSTLIVLVS